MDGRCQQRRYEVSFEGAQPAECKYGPRSQGATHISSTMGPVCTSSISRRHHALVLVFFFLGLKCFISMKMAAPALRRGLEPCYARLGNLVTKGLGILIRLKSPSNRQWNDRSGARFDPTGTRSDGSKASCRLSVSKRDRTMQASSKLSAPFLFD